MIELFKTDLCWKGIFLPEELNLEFVHKETPRGIGGSLLCLAVKGEPRPLSDNTLHRGIRDQGREDYTSAPARSLTKMKSTAENSLPQAAQSEAGLPNTLIKEENTRLSEAPSTPPLSTEIQYIHFHITHSLTSGKEIPAQLQHYIPFIPLNIFNLAACNFFIP